MTRGRLSPALATTSRIYELWDSARRGRGVLTDTAGRHHTTPRGTRAPRSGGARARGATTKGAWPARKTEGGGKEGGRKKTKYVERESEREERRQQAGRQQSVVAM